MTFFRYALRFFTIFLLLFLLSAGGIVIGSRYFSFGGGLLIRGANYFGASRNITLQSREIHGNPLRGYSFEDLLLSWENRPFFRARRLNLAFSLGEFLKGGTPLKSLEMQNWSADLDLALSLPSSSEGLPLEYFPEALSLDKGSLLWNSRKYDLCRLEGTLREGKTMEVRELSARLGSPEPLPLFFRGLFSYQEEKLSLSGGELYLETFPQGEAPDLLLSGDILPRQNLALLFEELPLKRLGKASILRESAQILGTLEGFLSGSASLEGAFPESWQGKTDLRISRAALGGICLASLDFRGSAVKEGPLEMFFRGEALSGGSLSGSLIAPESSEKNLEIRFTGTSLDLALGEAMDSRLASLSGILPSLEGTYTKREGIASGNLLFENVRGSYGDLSFEKFRGEFSLSRDRVESSLKGLLEHLPLEGGGTLTLRKEGSPEMDLFLRSPGTPLHRLKSVLPSLEPLKLEGSLAWELLLRGTPEDLRASGTLRSEKIRLRGELLEFPEASLRYEKNVLFLQKARLSWKDVLLQGQGEVRNIPDRPNLDLAISALPKGNRWIAESLSPETLEFFSPKEGAKLSVLVKGPLEHIEGSLSAVLPSVKTPLGTTRKTSLEAKITSRELGLQPLHIPLSSGGELRIEGSLQFSPSGEFHPLLNGEIRNLPLDPLKDFGVPLQGMLRGQFRLRGTGTKPELSFSLTSPELVFEEYRGRKLSCKGSLSPETLHLEELKGLFWDGKIHLQGTLEPFGNNPKLDFQGTFDEINLMNTQDILNDAGIYLKGTAGGTLSVRGPLASPEVTLNLSSSKLFLNSLPFENVAGTLQLSPEEIRLEPLTVHIGSSPLEVSVVVLPKKSWNTSFSAQAKTLDLKSLLQSWELYSEEKPFYPGGTLSLSVKGEVQDGGLRGKGILESPKIFAGKIHAENLRLPFDFNETSFSLKKGKASFYGGTLGGEGSLDYSQKPALWKTRIRIEEFQVAPFLRDLHPLSGDISGTGTFDIALKGPLNYVFMTSGEGSLHIREGAFSGFPQLSTLLAKSRATELDFASLQAYFSVDGRTLYFVPGSRLTAPPGHNIYRYFSADGFLPFTGKPMNINCNTEVNAPAINAFLGAFAGFLETVFLADDITQLTNITKAVEDALLGGIFGGLSRNDFREISFSLKGTMEEPKLENLSIAAKQKAFMMNPLEKDSGEKTPDFQISLSFPVGKGRKTSDDLSEQILEQVIKQVIPLGE